MAKRTQRASQSGAEDASASRLPSDESPSSNHGSGIVDNRIAGTRITVWDIVYYLEKGRNAEEITEALPLTLNQVRRAMQYIEEHKSEVMAVHRKIEERMARGNAPELQAKLDASHARFLEMVNRVRQTETQEATGAGDPGGQ